MTISRQRRYSKLAAGMLVGLFLFSTGYNYFERAGIWAIDEPTSVTVFVVSVSAVSFVVYYGSWRNLLWAKIIFLLSQAASFYFVIKQYSTIISDGTDSWPSQVLLFQQLVALIITILVLLSLRKPSSEQTLN